MAGHILSRTLTLPRTTTTILVTSFIVLWLVRGSQSLLNSNVEKSGYDSALRKWKSSHVTDYEEIVQHSSLGKWKLIVHVDNSISTANASYLHKIKHAEALDSEAANLTDTDGFLPIITIGGLFDQVEDQVYCQDNPCWRRDFYLPTYMNVDFDTISGYPRSVKDISEYAIVETKIESVRILK
jgi:hypothetical protein